MHRNGMFKFVLWFILWFTRPSLEKLLQSKDIEFEVSNGKFTESIRINYQIINMIQNRSLRKTMAAYLCCFNKLSDLLSKAVLKYSGDIPGLDLKFKANTIRMIGAAMSSRRTKSGGAEIVKVVELRTDGKCPSYYKSAKNAVDETHSIPATDLSPQKRVDRTSELNHIYERTKPSLEQSEGTKRCLAQALERDGMAVSDSETTAQRSQQQLSSAETKHDHMERQLGHLKQRRLILPEQLKQAKPNEECPELVTKEEAPMPHARSDGAVYETAAKSEDERNTSVLADSETIINDESHASTDQCSVPIDVTRPAQKLEPSWLNNPEQFFRQNALDTDRNKSVEKYIVPQRRGNSGVFAASDCSFSPFGTLSKKCERKNSVSQENYRQTLSNTTTSENRNADSGHKNDKERVSRVREFPQFAPYTGKQALKMDSSTFVRPINGKMQNTAGSLPNGHEKYATVVQNTHVRFDVTQVSGTSSCIGTNQIAPSNEPTKSIEQDDSAVTCTKSSENEQNTAPPVEQSGCQHLSGESCCRPASSVPHELDTTAGPSATGNVDIAANPNYLAHLSFYASANKELIKTFLANLRRCSADSPMFGSIQSYELAYDTTF